MDSNFAKHWGSTATKLVDEVKMRHPVAFEKTLATSTSIAAGAATELVILPMEIVLGQGPVNVSPPIALAKAVWNVSYATGLSFPISDALRNRVIVKTKLSELKPWQFGLVVGAINEVVMGLLFTPIDNIREKRRNDGTGFLSAAGDLVMDEGVSALYNNYFSNCLNRIPLSSTMTAIGESSPSWLRALGYNDPAAVPKKVQFLTSGGMAITALAATTPVDIAKRMISSDDSDLASASKSAVNDSLNRMIKMAPRAGMKRVFYLSLRQQLSSMKRQIGK